MATATTGQRVGRVLGVTTGTGAAASLLPDTGVAHIGTWLAVASLGLGLIVIASFLGTRLVRKMAKR